MKNRRNLFVLVLVVFSLAGVDFFAQQPAPQPTPVVIKIAPESFDPFVGQYEDRENLGGIVFSFFREGEKYYLRLTNQDKLEILPQTANKFFLSPGNRGDVEFVRDADGRVTGAIFSQGARYILKRTASVPAPDTRVIFSRTEAMIPMRDGVKLFTVILTPQDQNEDLPIYMERTPYGVAGWNSERLNNVKPELAHDGYIFVFQDIRGREDSEGVFEMLRPPRDKRDPKSIDESTDTYDTIEYLLKNTKNNGRVGIAGVSYPGWLAAVAMIDPHPALKASSPQAPVTDLWMGDDFMHNGAFRQTYAHHWAVPLESAKKGGDVEIADPDMYNYYLNGVKLSSLSAELATRSHSWKAFREHPTWDAYWQAKATNVYLKETSVPTLVVGGWWDQEDLYGPLALYRSLEKTDRDNQVNLVMGPWNHGGWGGRGRRLGAIDFGSDTGRHFRSEIQAPFFAYHLKGKGTLKLPEAWVFRSGSNEWKAYEEWTPKVGLQRRGLYLNADGKLSFEKPSASGEAFDSYMSDPSNPVPYRKRPIVMTYGQGSTWFTWLVDDQRFLSDRKDVLSWTTDALTDDVTVTGDIIAELFAATSGSDSDWVVKLIDVYPSDLTDERMRGYELMVASEIFRGRYRKSYEKAEALKSNTPLEYEIDMRGNDHTFLKGHRIKVQVQSSWFPLYDRNPQKFVPNIFMANDADYQAARQKIYRSARYPSHIRVSVAP